MLEAKAFFKRTSKPEGIGSSFVPDTHWNGTVNQVLNLFVTHRHWCLSYNASPFLFLHRVYFFVFSTFNAVIYVKDQWNFPSRGVQFYCHISYREMEYCPRAPADGIYVEDITDHGGSFMMWPTLLQLPSFQPHEKISQTLRKFPFFCWITTTDHGLILSDFF